MLSRYCAKGMHTALTAQRANHFSVLIIGGGQAALSISYYLKQKDVRHMILEKNRIGHAWRDERWDSFCLVTPN